MSPRENEVLMNNGSLSKICAICNNQNHFDETWGNLLRSLGVDPVMCQSKSELIKLLKNDSFDAVIVDNDLGEGCKGHTLISHLKMVKLLPYTTLTILCTSQPLELFMFNPVDLRADIVSSVPFNKQSALNALTEAQNRSSSESQIRKAFMDNNFNKILSIYSSSKNNSSFYSELLFESASKFSDSGFNEAKLFRYLDNALWPAFILSRKYIAENNLCKLSSLVELAKEKHPSNIGMAYLYFLGHTLISNLELSEQVEIHSSSLSNLPQYLFWLAEHQFSNCQFKKAIEYQLDAINSVKNTDFEDSKMYEKLVNYTDSYISSEDFSDGSYVNEVSASLSHACKRGVINQSVSISGDIFKIRSLMLLGPNKGIANELISLFNNNFEFINKYPDVIQSLLDFIYSNQTFRYVMLDLESKLCNLSTSGRKAFDNIHASDSKDIKINKLKSEAIEFMNIEAWDEAEEKLDQVLGNSPGNIEASYLKAKCLFAIIQRAKGFAKNSYIQKISHTLEKASPPRNEWEAKKIKDIKNELLMVS